MRVAVFDTHRFERRFFEQENKSFGHVITYLEPRLTLETAGLARGFPCVCPFVNDRLDAETLKILFDGGTRLLALRSAGFNHVDLVAAEALGFKVVRVPEYSPYAVAEHAVALILALNRKIHRAHSRIREGNFTLDGLVGFDLHRKTVGIIGTGRIGSVMAHIMKGFGCNVLAYDITPNRELEALGVRYLPLEEVLGQSDILSLHIPLTPATRHLIDEWAISLMKPGVMLINTGRGALIDSQALILALKKGQIASAGLDVYEEEEGIFFQDLSEQVLQDDTLARLLTFPNVVLTSHQAFLTQEALTNIAATTLRNISDFEMGKELVNQVSVEANVRRSA